MSTQQGSFFDFGVSKHLESSQSPGENPLEVAGLKEEDLPSEDIDPPTAASSSSSSSTLSFLIRADVHGETVLEVVGDKPQKLEWPGYGFYIKVPEGALPPGVTASVRVKVILGGQFKFPENSQLISALYWISSSEVFLKEVAVNIEHCAVIKTEEQCSSFRFIIAKSSQTAVPYTFKEREGYFNPHTQYGTIKLKRFCAIGATAPTDGTTDSAETRCAALMFYKKRMTCPFVVDFHFVVVKDLESYLQRVHKEYQGWSKDNASLKLCFNSNTTIQLNQEEQEVDSWRILPLTLPLQVTNGDVCNFKQGGSIPHCPFVLQFERCCGLKTYQQLFHKVDVLGAAPRSFHIRYPQPNENKMQVFEQTKMIDRRHEQAPAAAVQSNSVNQLVEAVSTVTDWHGLGLRLGLTMNQLREIELTYHVDGLGRQKAEMFHVWLNSSQRATWGDLITALRAMNEHTVASDIEAVHSPTTKLNLVINPATVKLARGGGGLHTYHWETMAAIVALLAIACSALLFYLT